MKTNIQDFDVYLWKVFGISITTLFSVQTKVTYCKNISKFLENWTIFMWFIVETYIQTDRQTNLKFSHGNKLTVERKWNGNRSNNNEKYA